MIHLTKALVRRWLDRLLHVDDTPERTAAAFAMGVFFGFSPFLGFHTVLGILFAFVFNLNRVAALLGVYSNLPWIIAPYYILATMVGAEITQQRIPPGFRGQLRALFELSSFDSEFWRQLVVVMTPLARPYAVGSTLGALLMSAAAYQLALAFVKSRKRIHEIIHKH